MVCRVAAQVVLEIFGDQARLAPSAGKGAGDRFHPARLLVFGELRAFDVLGVAVVRASYGVARTDPVVCPCDDLVGVLVVAILAADPAQAAQLHEVLLHVTTHHRLPALVHAEDGLVQTSLGRMEVGFNGAHLASPLAPALVVWTVDLEHVDALLKVLVLEVVEFGSVAVGACGGGRHLPLDAALAVVVATAHHLDRLP